MCQLGGVWGHGVKGEVRDKVGVEVLIPSAIEGENVSYEALGPADIFTPSLLPPASCDGFALQTQDTL